MLLLFGCFMILFQSSYTYETCPDENPVGKPVPTMNGSYVAFMEWWHMDTHTFLYREEFVDEEANMAAIRIHGMNNLPGEIDVYISDYNTRQLYTISDREDGKSCVVSDLDDFAGEESFAHILTSNSTKEHIARTNTLLKFGKGFNERYLGVGPKIRGKDSETWVGCLCENSSNTCVVSEYFFSNIGWHSSSANNQVPLRSIIEHSLPDGTATNQIQIDYVYFSHDINDKSIFQLASGLYCEGRKATKPIPELPEHFRYRSEVVLPTNQETDIFDEIYDTTTKMVQIESRSSRSVGSGVVTLLDFNAGLSYLISSGTGQCQIKPMTQDDFNTQMTDADHIRMATVKEFFRFDSGLFVYSGQKKVRGIDCDSWTGISTNFPIGKNLTSHWTWYFALASWKTGQPEQVPVYLEINVPKSGMKFWYNFYDFRTDDFIVDAIVDLSPCFQHTELRNIQFDLRTYHNNNLEIKALNKVPKLYRQQMTQTLSEVMQVSPLRISRFQSYLDSVPPSVSFTLLPSPEMEDILKTNATTLDETVGKLNDTINDEKSLFLFKLKDNLNKKILLIVHPVPGSFHQTIRLPNGTLKHSFEPGARSSSLTCPTSAIAVTTTSPSSTPSSSSRPAAPPQLASPAPLHDARVAFITTPLTESTNEEKEKSCEDEGNDSDPSMWTTETVVGLSVGLCLLGVLIGVLGTGFVQGWARPPCLRRQSNGDNEDIFLHDSRRRDLWK